MAKLGNFNELRVATEDYLRSRRIFKTTSAGNTDDEDSMEVDVISRKKQATQTKVTGKRQQNTHDSKVNVESVESMDTKQLIVGTSKRPNLKAKARAQGSRNAK